MVVLTGGNLKFFALNSGSKRDDEIASDAKFVLSTGFNQCPDGEYGP